MFNYYRGAPDGASLTVILDAAKAVRVEHEVARRGGFDLKRYGGELIGPCPRCGGRDRFAISIVKQCFLCRGCGAAGDIIAMVQHVDGVDFRTAVRTLAGFRPEVVVSADLCKNEHRPIDLVNQAAIDLQNSQRALKIWNDAVPIGGAIAEQYLHRRGLHDLPGDGVLRFHPSCPYGKAHAACLIGLYRDIATDEPKAISRTAVDAAGNKVGRMSLGPVGSAAIKVDDDPSVEYGLTISDGLETGPAGRRIGLKPCWSLGSSGAIKNFGPLPGIGALTILVDHDEPDRQAGQEAAAACSELWTAAGVEVRRVLPRAIGADMAELIEQEGGGRHG